MKLSQKLLPYALVLQSLVTPGCASLDHSFVREARIEIVDRLRTYPLDAPKLLKEGAMTAQQLFKHLQRLGLKPFDPIYAKDPSAPTFIILADVHGSPETEKKKLDILRENLNINFVGLEGWAGAEVDRERGYDLMNAEIELIKQLRTDEKFEVVGLEDQGAQERALKGVLTLAFIEAYYAQKVLAVYADSDDPMHKIECIVAKSAMHKYLGMAHSLFQSFQINTIDPTEDDRNEYDWFLEDLFSVYEIESSRLSQADDESDEKYLKRLSQYKDHIESLFLPNKLLVDDRNQAAISIMQKTMQGGGQKLAVIVFGLDHVDGLAEEIKKQIGDANIISL